MSFGDAWNEDIGQDEFLAKLRADEDQVTAAVIAMGRLICQYRATLLTGGFRDDEVFELVQAYHAVLLDKLMEPDSPPVADE